MRFSEPKLIEAKGEFKDVEKHLADRLREHGRTALSEEVRTASVRIGFLW